MCNPHARTNVHELSLNKICPLDKIEDPGCDRCRLFERRRRADQQVEFVSAQACNNVTLTRGCLQPFCRKTEQGIAGRMAKRVVDCFEAVQIDQEHRDGDTWNGCKSFRYSHFK